MNAALADHPQGPEQLPKKNEACFPPGKNDLRLAKARALFKVPVRKRNAGWSSPVARQAHNLKVAGSNPAPATNFSEETPEKPGVFRYLDILQNRLATYGNVEQRGLLFPESLRRWQVALLLRSFALAGIRLPARIES